MSANIKNTEKSQINDWMLHHKVLEKQKQVKLKSSRSWEIIKIRAKINEIETKKAAEKQWNKKLVLWKDKQDQQTPGKSD
jgi:hypothetical protein